MESVQWYARFTCRDYRRTSNVSAMLQKLQWDSLQQRRACSRVLMLYRIRNGLVAIPAAAYLEPVPICTRRFETRYVQIQCNTGTCYLLSKCNPVVEHSVSRRLLGTSWHLQDPPQQFPFHLSTAPWRYSVAASSRRLIKAWRVIWSIQCIG